MPHEDTTPELRETAYVWDIASDRLEWQSGAASVLGIANLNAIATGEAFAARIRPEHQAAWRSAVLGRRASGEAPHGIPYRVQFALESEKDAAGENVWLEDQGRWWPGPDGRPCRAQGVLSRIGAGDLENRHLLRLTPGDDIRESLNRARLFEAVAARMKRTDRTGRPCGLLMIAVNGLDAINARLGPDVGDEFITAVGRLIKANLAEADTIVRHASNTFAVILDDCGTDTVSHAAERLIARIERATVETSAGPLKTSISIGAIAVPDHANTAADAIARARSTLEHAKRLHRSHVVCSGTEASAPQSKSTVTGEVMSALEEDRLVLALQSIVDAATGKTAFYEALLRLRRRDGTLVAAADFIEEAEQLGLAKLLDLRALERALALLSTHPRLKLSLNVSSLTLGDRDWIATLETSAANDASLAPRLTVEITETAMIHDLYGVRAFVELLRKIGCRTAIDDFGTGYTSFRHLKTLPIDMLKIDGMFVNDLPNDHRGRVIVGSMIEMAKGLGLETVAEWVRDRETAEFLKAAGATYLQGFFYANPETPEELQRKGLL